MLFIAHNQGINNRLKHQRRVFAYERRVLKFMPYFSSQFLRKIHHFRKLN